VKLHILLFVLCEYISEAR